MMRRGSVYVGITVVVCLTGLPFIGKAMVTGQCGNCHTMHNSQNNAAMNYNSSGTTSPPGSATPNDLLLRWGNCIGCHTGTNNGANTIPYVYSTGAPTYDPTFGGTGNTLAGGNFYWVATAGGAVDADGHNVDMVAAADGTLSTPPGYDDATVAWTTRLTAQSDSTYLTCAGTAGCHGDRTKTTNNAAVKGAHHTDDTGGITGASVGLSFRFLNGILGTEINAGSDAWEYTNSNAAHNEYYGVDRTDDTVVVTSTINYLCAECHGAFHNSSSGGTSGIQGTAWGSPWVRHPTDYDMNNKAGTTEYASYTTYDTNVPIGHDVLLNSTSDTEAYEATDTNGAIVLCISCHRAHGSPYPALLRWNYRQWPGSGGTNGCSICHSSKN